ncbi:MAG: peptide chain release factor 2 [Liquorilactobacillus nagelii]|uniref:peptide chain release factor 2 n=1 Tax=Liquorilactobacillus nagelii TaxID=82688 RepID=UPI001CC973FB|nr:peptide chain release factor 2 [Liquorilactobacillus nagelii]MCI1633286.1 peptide chain release factor 2 [Liquorilactobacillus nagelii]MCI1921799.1 peptide chain release factor 2 [Liquorilactobacillus nagelii]MCI1976749.1 peptide chain release factor 2 [Liquorilactobacillus nagelii]ULQ50454.1 peptide chain release factor 2 [Liquorilactobacillus nagelii]
MEISEAKKMIENMKQKVQDFRGSLDLEALNEKISENEAQMADPDFWNDQSAAQKVIDETNILKTKFDNFKVLSDAVDELEILTELLKEDPTDQETQTELNNKLTIVQQKLQAYQLELLLNGKYDSHNALLEIHPGAGGTESQDWGSMLLRMYDRWGQQHHFKVEVLDYLAGEEAGLKSVTLQFSGKNAYGYLRSEKGVHRLVRISPFDAAGRRHTSFASVNVMPELDDSVEIELRPEDIKMEVFRSSGAGGQHINKTSSAVRLIHIPTGIVVSSQAQRSQFQNRATAESMLRARLYQLKLEEQAKKKAAIQGQQLEIGWGSQIRSYVFHPYSMVKDHRTGYETGNIQSVMDGDLDGFINAYLQSKLSAQNPD